MVKDNGGSQYDFVSGDVKDAFKAGAEWQAKQSPWISVEDRLPETEDEVLCLYVITLANSNQPLIGPNQYKDGKWQARMLTKYKTLSWMPIPSFDDILEANKDVLQRMKEKGD